MESISGTICNTSKKQFLILITFIVSKIIEIFKFFTDIVRKAKNHFNLLGLLN
jgi:hypothetical protein